MSKTAYEVYQDRIAGIIRETLDGMECQPIFFIGTGMSKRYFGAPNWSELLKGIATYIGVSDDDFHYLSQKVESDNIKLGNELAAITFEWAWKGGKNSFPADYFSSERRRSDYFKYVVSKQIEKTCPVPERLDTLEMFEEIEKLKKSHPHAILTTNYDNFLEKIFPSYETIVGQKIIRRDMNIVGEIFKIHGSLEDPSSIVITEEDYKDYNRKKKYISAKMLTYFAEHPVFIFGYGLSDPNVSGLIEDIGEILCGGNGLIENIFYVEWRPDAAAETQFREEYVIGTGQSQLRVRTIVANSFGWIFDAISNNNPLKWVEPRVLRAIASRVFNIVRKDIPRANIEIDYKHLSSIAEAEDAIPKLLGIGSTLSPNASYPYNLTAVGKRLGYRGWHGANELISKIKQEKRFDMKASDNVYHCSVKSGEGYFHLYSDEAINILKLVKEGKDYIINEAQ